MAKIDLGPIGAVLSPAESNAPEVAVELESLGYSTIWVTGGPLESLDELAAIVHATKTVTVASAIIPVERFDAPSVAALYEKLEASHPGRFVVGLGGAHGPKPFATLRAYLDRLEAVPPTARLMAALGPRKLELARERSAGALPVLVDPDYTARARAILGPDATLAVEQLVVLDTDAQRARQLAREPLGFLGQVPAYQANFRAMGFSDDEIERLDDRLVDALIAWGDVDAIAARVSAHVDAGADHVALSPVTGTSGEPPLDEWRRLAAALTPR